MALCDQCGLQEAQTGLLCNQCISDNRSKHAGRVRQQQLAVSTTRQDLYSMGVGFWLKFVAGTALILFLLQQSFGIFGYGRLDYVATSPSEGAKVDACDQRRLCFVALVTPWCPACHGAIPFLQSVRKWAESHPDIGVQIVVGADEEENLRQMGGQIGSPYYLDLDRKFTSNMPGRGVPRWAVIDSKRKIINRGAGLPAIDSSHPGFVGYLTEELGLK